MTSTTTTNRPRPTGKQDSAMRRALYTIASDVNADVHTHTHTRSGQRVTMTHRFDVWASSAEAVACAQCVADQHTPAGMTHTVRARRSLGGTIVVTVTVAVW